MTTVSSSHEIASSLKFGDLKTIAIGMRVRIADMLEVAGRVAAVGHPERTMLPGLKSTNGPLGSGLSQAAGYAYALCYLRDEPQADEKVAPSVVTSVIEGTSYPSTKEQK